MGKNSKNRNEFKKVNRVAKLSRLKKMIQSLEVVTGDKDVDISYEYICASLFPGISKEIEENIKDFGTFKYMEGFADGQAKALEGKE